jgi:hypothetical protein
MNLKLYSFEDKFGRVLDEGFPNELLKVIKLKRNEGISRKVHIVVKHLLVFHKFLPHRNLRLTNVIDSAPDFIQLVSLVHV